MNLRFLKYSSKKIYFFKCCNENIFLITVDDKINGTYFILLLHQKY